jgi:hypothetical protein
MTNSTAKSEPRLEDVNGILLPNHDPIKKFANRRRNQSNSLVMVHVPVRGTVTFGRHVPASETGGLPSVALRDRELRVSCPVSSTSKWT